VPNYRDTSWTDQFKLGEVYVILHEYKLAIKKSEREPQLSFFSCGLRFRLNSEWTSMVISLLDAV